MAERKKVLTVNRGQIKARITRFETYIEKALPENANEARIRLEHVKDALAEFNEIQSELELIDENELTGNERDNFENKYFAILSKATEFVEKHIIRTPTTSAAASDTIDVYALPRQSDSIQQKNVKLPTLDLPKFYGDYVDWVHFDETFCALVHNDPYMDDINKFYYLISCLKGDAAKTIASLEITRDNYKIARDLLKERFENKEKIIKTHVSALFELPAITKESHMHLRRLLDDYNRHTRALKALGEPVKQWGTLLIHILARKLDETTRFKWEEHVVETYKRKQIPDAQSMIDFLTNRCNVFETIERGKPKIGKVSAHLTVDKAECYLCKGNHMIYNCGKFKDLDVKTKYNEAKRLKLCINCLKGGHFASKCKSLSTCKKCAERHNTLLHVAKPIPTATNITPENTKENDEQPTVQALNATNEQNVFLSTAIVEVKNGEGKWQRARALLDSGSQSNFITNDLTQRLKLHTYKVDLPVTGINQTATRITEGVSTQIKSIYNNFHANLSFLTIEQISDEFPNFRVKQKEMQIPAQVKLADPNFCEPSQIDLLLGAGIFAQLVSIGQIKLGSGLPTLQKSVLGWIVSGPVAICNLNIHNPKIHCSLTIDKIGKQLENF
ncbi:uncharacterized protein [Onthophagus taurus]|uniref:uncharacterized protein n=1 Tax=Onthophagus taurus TaxID=166361 RepID=UPI0039BE7160